MKTYLEDIKILKEKFKEAFAPKELEYKSIILNEDINKVLNDINN